MSGAACAKEILDRPMAMAQVVGCLANTVQLASNVGVMPTDEEAAELTKACEGVAKAAQKIERRLRREAWGEESGGGYGEGGGTGG